MGLDAVVYRNSSHLPFDLESCGAKVDGRTGEVYFEDSAADRVNGDIVVALSRRLGNVSDIASLSEEIGRHLGRQDGILLNKILFSGTHAGDVIEQSHFSEIRAEIAELRRSAQTEQVPGVTDLVRDIEDLMAAALSEGNPIVFT